MSLRIVEAGLFYLLVRATGDLLVRAFGALIIGVVLIMIFWPTPESLEKPSAATIGPPQDLLHNEDSLSPEEIETLCRYGVLCPDK